MVQRDVPESCQLRRPYIVEEFGTAKSKAFLLGRQQHLPDWTYRMPRVDRSGARRYSRQMRLPMRGLVLTLLAGTMALAQQAPPPKSASIPPSASVQDGHAFGYYGGEINGPDVFAFLAANLGPERPHDQHSSQPR